MRSTFIEANRSAGVSSRPSNHLSCQCIALRSFIHTTQRSFTIHMTSVHCLHPLFTMQTAFFSTLSLCRYCLFFRSALMLRSYTYYNGFPGPSRELELDVPAKQGKT